MHGFPRIAEDRNWGHPGSLLPMVSAPTLKGGGALTGEPWMTATLPVTPPRAREGLRAEPARADLPSSSSLSRTAAHCFARTVPRKGLREQTLY